MAAVFPWLDLAAEHQLVTTDLLGLVSRLIAAPHLTGPITDMKLFSVESTDSVLDPAAH